MFRRLLSQSRMASTCAALLAGISASVSLGDLFVGGQTGDIWRGDPTNGTFTYFTCACVGQINSLASDGPNIYLVDHFTNLWTINVNQQTFTNVFVGIGNDGQGLAVDGADLLAGGGSTIIRIDKASGQAKSTLNTPLPIAAMLLEGQTVFYGSPAGVVQKGNKDSGGFQFLGICGGQINSMLKVGSQLFLGDVNGNVYVYNEQTFQVSYLLSVDSDATALAWHDGALLVGGTNKNIYRVNPQNAQVIGTLVSPVPVGALLLHEFCAADLTGDGAVNQADLALLLSAYEVSAAGDVDGDFDTDQQDLAALLASYQMPCN